MYNVGGNEVTHTNSNGSVQIGRYMEMDQITRHCRSIIKTNNIHLCLMVSTVRNVVASCMSEWPARSCELSKLANTQINILNNNPTKF
jgi:hypothetical protein